MYLSEKEINSLLESLCDRLKLSYNVVYEGSDIRYTFKTIKGVDLRCYLLGQRGIELVSELSLYNERDELVLNVSEDNQLQNLMNTLEDILIKDSRKLLLIKSSAPVPVSVPIDIQNNDENDNLNSGRSLPEFKLSIADNYSAVSIRKFSLKVRDVLKEMHTTCTVTTEDNRNVVKDVYKVVKDESEVNKNDYKVYRLMNKDVLLGHRYVFKDMCIDVSESTIERKGLIVNKNHKSIEMKRIGNNWVGVHEEESVLAIYDASYDEGILKILINRINAGKEII